ncbi:hypothetical protein ACI8AV_13115 [Geodermatophilus sp. SYSU D00804]
MSDRVVWRTAPPLWRTALDGALALDRPVVLRFDTDDFMTRLQDQLHDREHRDVGGFVVRPETWRQPAAGLDGAAGAGVPTLYHPMHSRFYLVTGALVCARYGLPDKVVRPGCAESAFYVLRRLAPVTGCTVDPAAPATYRELGWVPAGAGGAWVDPAGALAPGEERLPLFPLTYADRHRRRMLAGLVPVSARDRYEQAVPPPPVPSGTGDPIAVLALPGRARLESAVLGLRALLQLAGTPALGNDRPGAVGLFREAAFFALVDLAGLLADELPGVWAGTATGGHRGALVALLTRHDFGPAPHAPTWLSALHTAHAGRDLVLADLAGAPEPVTGMAVADISGAVAALGVDPDGDTTSDALFGAVDSALREQAGASGPAAPPAGGPVPEDRTTGGVYVARLVYERPLCRPPERLTLSEPTAPFRFAHLYDPDAPVRPIRIVLPVDTSLQGLRKHPRAVSMELSAQLRRQIDRIVAIKLKDLDDGDIPDEQPLDLGMVCALSIPIITICALVLLMIIVSLLNIVFFWLPLFKTCLPRAS